MEYIAFTEEEKERAGAVNLVEFLTRQGEEMEPSGSEWRWKRHDSVTVRDNIWYRHSCKYGGSPIQFLQEFYDMTYVEAMKSLLEGNYQPVLRDGGSIPLKTKNRGRFQLPEPYENAKRVMPFLSGHVSLIMEYSGALLAREISMKKRSGIMLCSLALTIKEMHGMPI